MSVGSENSQETHFTPGGQFIIDQLKRTEFPDPITDERLLEVEPTSESQKFKAQEKEQIKKEKNQEDVVEGTVVPFAFENTPKSFIDRIGSENDELFKTLQSTIKEGLDMEFIDKKKKKLSEIAQVAPVFSFKQFFLFFWYHMAFHLILGPILTWPLVHCIEGKVFAKNLIFSPQNNFSYNSTLTIWLFYIIAVSIAIKNHYDVEEDPNVRRLDLYPLYVTTFFLITRCFVVGTRYASTPPKIINRIRNFYADEEYYND